MARVRPVLTGVAAFSALPLFALATVDVEGLTLSETLLLTGLVGAFSGGSWILYSLTTRFRK
ncbi:MULTISPECIES: hypothetical protein [Pseudovibrio]|uniref:hypothetical protein n=1 Tax=Stappiaceae TaxID=2821832 RepID=UPI002365C152|nr:MULTISPECIES: hypothetical protein [Pseudovibrio]MDD7910235.1 hypothetical protein [Pseudovibrio exalbescens]MDX5593948.1 hypothetical protein [Pseudovibrio sp. SPO723]